MGDSSWVPRFVAKTADGSEDVTQTKNSTLNQNVIKSEKGSRFRLANAKDLSQ